jgi:hypothetical protein
MISLIATMGSQNTIVAEYPRRLAMLADSSRAEKPITRNPKRIADPSIAFLIIVLSLRDCRYCVRGRIVGACGAENWGATNSALHFGQMGVESFSSCVPQYAQNVMVVSQVHAINNLGIRNQILPEKKSFGRN